MKKAFLFFLLVVILGLVGVFLVISVAEPAAPDMVAVNDAVMTAFQSDDRGVAMDAIVAQLQLEFERINTEARRWEAILVVIVCVYATLVAAAGLLLFLYCERSLLAPFRKMQRFARDVAAGNLDIPLEMDRRGRFGAFTESFDMMREELKKARENERAADRGKKELVASLSHDIKTPVASIKATTELMLVTSKDEKEKRRLERIEAKAEQINTLITNMFHATLEELQALSVTLAELPSTSIPGLIETADHKNMVKPFHIPSCIISADLVRLQQIFDNIIGNSYKYAGTEIEIHAGFDGPFLYVDVLDRGAGVPDEELPLIFNKFYRGKNADEKSGYGLGMFISKTLLRDMSGDITCENRQGGGFAVRIMLRLAGID